MSTEEVLRIGKKLEKIVSTNGTGNEQAGDLLKALQDMKMDLDVLQKTRIGMIVNSYRKWSTDEDIVALSKNLIKGWKKLLPAGGEKGDKASVKETTKDASKQEKSSASSSKEKDRSSPVQKSFPLGAADTTDSVRLKCREMIANALKAAPLPDMSGDPDDIAAQIEDNIYMEFRNTDTKYKNRIRSRFANLKDLKNPQLRENVLTGAISINRIATMSSEEMASEDMKELRNKFTKEAINDHQMSVTSGTTTDLLKCSKCKKRNCTYNQVQTRSADEPMTTFVYCNECGHRWKFC